VKVKYGDRWLAPGGREAAQDVRLNGTQTVQVAQALRAAAVRTFGRGNRVETFSFAVRLGKESKRLAERAAFAELASLPANAQLEVVCGGGDDVESFFLPAAAFQTVERTLLGRSPALTYTFLGGLWTTEGETIIPEEGDVLRFKLALTEGDITKAVAFTTPLGTPPTTVQCWIVPPDDGDFIDARPIKSSIAVGGFTARFAAEIPGAGYELHCNVVK
jgi:hypothetical protein